MARACTLRFKRNIACKARHQGTGAHLDVVMSLKMANSRKLRPEVSRELMQTLSLVDFI